MRNPINRLVAILGLVMLGAIGYQVALGELALETAAIRAGVTLLAVVAVRRLGRIGMSLLADSMERQAPAPRRRVDD